jgi:predicted metal-binding protein
VNWLQISPVIDYSVRGLCVREYPGHKHGCPNFNKKAGCPPQAALFDDVYDLTKPVYVIWNQFDIVEHMKRMRDLHPGWSERQVRCCLYWQPKARKQLQGWIADFLKAYPGLSVETCPEAMGVNVVQTMKVIGTVLEWPPERFVYQVALAGQKK